MSNYLKENYIIKHPSISGVYKIIKANKDKVYIGDGANTIAYEAEYTINGLKSIHILKEYFPKSININRDEEGRLIYDNIDKFNKGKEKFIAAGKRQNELRKIGNLTNETPQLLNIFEFNNTVYLDVIKYEGSTLDKVSNLTLIDKIKLCFSICKLVDTYHNNGYLCLDLKPQNIFVLKDKTELIHFIDFDSIEKKENIKFGNNVHNYSLHWSAPEQRNPFAYSKISEKSDIYALGEIVFWCLFGRNSTDKEQRLNSIYTYDESKYYSDLNYKPKAKRIFTDLFKKTIRSSPNNRFDSVEKITLLLINLIKELEKETKIINSNISPNTFFVGREKELFEIQSQLSKNDFLAISGIGGIGKSEVVKKFILHNKDNFDYIIYLNYQSNLEITISSDSNLHIENISMMEEDNYEQYAIRKLNVLLESITESSIFVLDNINISFDKMNKNILSIIKKLPCKKIFVSRCIEENYNQIVIEEIKEEDSVLKIFDNYCSYEKDERKYVRLLMEKFNYHTLLVELIAKQINAMHISPKDMVEKLNNKESLLINNVEVSLLKDDLDTFDSVYNHISQLYVINNMTEKAKAMLFELSLLCPIGIEIDKFIELYKHEENDVNEINWLIRYGWINFNNKFISIHPCIQQIIIFELKKDFVYIDQIFNKLIKTTNTKYHTFFVNIINNIIDFNVNSKNACIFIHKFLRFYSDKKMPKDYILLNEFFINNYKNYCGEYSALLEIAYLNKIIFENQDFSKIIDFVDYHINMCRKNNDIYVQGLWIVKVISYFLNNDNFNYFKFLKYNNRFKQIIRCYVNNKKLLKLNDEQLLNTLDYNYILSRRKSFLLDLLLNYVRMFESDGLDIIFCSKYSTLGCMYLNTAIKKRRFIKKYYNSYSNEINMLFDFARKEYLKLNYHNALNYSFAIVKIMEKIDIENYWLFKTFWLIAHIYLDQKNINEAKNYYEKAIQIINKLEVTNSFGVTIEYYLTLAKYGNVNESLIASKKILEQIKLYPKDKASTYESEALFNIGFCYYLLKDYKSAKKYFIDSINTLNESISAIERKTFTRGRCYKYLYLIHKLTDIEKANTYYQKSVDNFKASLNDKHPELIELYNLKNDETQE